MRLELTLQPKNENYIIPLNYQYYLYISFFIIFDNASKEFLEWAKNNNFTNRNDRFFMYNFSFLKFVNERVVDTSKATITSYGEVKIIFTSPILDKGRQDYIINLLRDNNIHFYPAKRENQEFTIKEINLLDDVKFENEVDYKMSSVSCYFTNNYGHFFRIGDPNLEKRLIDDLKYKYELVYGKKYENELSLTFDKDYQANKKVTKLITMKENTEKEYKIRGFNCPLKLIAEPEMHYIAYTCGIGMKNKFGFGCLEILKPESSFVIDQHSDNKTKNNKAVTINTESETGIISKIKKVLGF